MLSDCTGMNRIWSQVKARMPGPLQGGVFYGSQPSIIASDITDNRVVFGGTAGLLEDSANLTFNGTTLAVTGTVTVGGQLSFNDNRISTTNSNENIDLDPSGTGTVNFAVPTQTTVGSAGAASNVPAAPTVYLKIRVSGVEYVIPAFAVS